jgi:hypothetical protein
MQIIRNISLLLLSLHFFLPQNILALEGKSGKSLYSGELDSYYNQTYDIRILVGNGSGENEEILGETLDLIDANDYYSVFLAVIAVEFAEYEGEAHQSRYVDNRLLFDGELLGTEAMDSLTTVGDTIEVSRGRMSDGRVQITQELYIRPASSDRFCLLKWTIKNIDTLDLTEGKFLLISDFDVGASAYDNITGIDSSNNLTYQETYSDTNDFYVAGFTPLFPSSSPQYGNYEGWYYYGNDDILDDFITTPQYDTSFENSPGDYSSYMVFSLGDLSPDSSAVLFIVFAVDTGMTALLSQIANAYDIYDIALSVSPLPVNELPIYFTTLSAYPNPFNSVIRINLFTERAGPGSIHIYDIRGAKVVSLYNGWLKYGNNYFEWGSDDGFQPIPSGIYFISAELENYRIIKKVVLIK